MSGKKSKKIFILMAMLFIIVAFSLPAVRAEAATRGNDTMKKATRIRVNKTYKDNLKRQNEHYYKIKLKKNGYICINMKHRSLTSGDRFWEIRVLNKNSDEYLYMESTGNNTNKTSGYLGLRAGTYYIKINDYYHSSKNYQFRVKYKSTKYWEKEGNNEIAKANKIKLNKTYNGAIQDGPENDDWYKIKFKKAGYVNINFKHKSLANSDRFWEIRILNVDNEELVYLESSGNEINKNSSYVGLPAGTYYIKVNQYYHSNIKYRFKVNYKSSGYWEKEFNNEMSTANKIKLNTTYNGVIQNGPENDDWYKVSLKSAGYVNINFMHKSLSNSDRFWEVRILNTNNEELVYLEVSGNEINKNSSYVGLPSGTYYIKVNQYYHSDAVYSFKVNYKSSQYWEKEFNNEMSTANKISLNTTYSGAIQNGPENDDWYAFNLDTSKQIRVGFSHSNLSNNDRFWEIRIYDIYGNEKLYMDSYGFDTNKLSEWINLAKGNYYIKINSYYHSDTVYSLIVKSY